MPPTTTVNNQPTNPEANQSNRRQYRRNTRQVTCQICHRAFREITVSHLRTHGFTLQQYRRAFSPAVCAPGAPHARSNGGRGRSAAEQAVGAEILERILGDPHAIRRLADEVSEALFSHGVRERLRMALLLLLNQRMQTVAQAGAALEQVRGELSARWRLEQGGKDGGPTPTSELASIAHVLAMEVKHGEELLVKTVKLALDEQRASGAPSTLGGLDVGRYQGEGEVLPVPEELSPAERETVRTLFEMVVGGGAEAARARAELVEVQVIDAVPAEPPTAPVGATGGLQGGGRNRAPGSSDGEKEPTPLRDDSEPF